MIVRTAIATLALAFGVACTTPPATEARPGSPAVYQRIETLTDCAQLQSEFDLAMDTWDRRKEDHSLAYGKAANARMQEVDCY